MKKETRKALMKSITDALGLPFYDGQSRELNRINKYTQETIDGIIDTFIDVMCGDCEYSCNEHGSSGPGYPWTGTRARARARL